MEPACPFWPTLKNVQFPLFFKIEPKFCFMEYLLGTRKGVEVEFNHARTYLTPARIYYIRGRP